MHSTNRFNLIDEAWIPIAGKEAASLRDIFSRGEPAALGGNAIQKIALFKLLLAIAQAARTPEDEGEWAALGAEGLGRDCLAYLEKHRDAFWLYGEKPFLQMPAMARAEEVSYGALLPHVATGNTPILFDSSRERALSDAEKAVLVVTLMGFGLGGKVDNSVILSEGYTGKRVKEKGSRGKQPPGKAGTTLGYLGYLHHFLTGESLLQSIWLNLLTRGDIQDLSVFTAGIGAAPWECMPRGENCATARALKDSLMGRLVPLSKFFLLDKDGVHYSDGILHPTYKDGGLDPSIAVNLSGKEPKALWTDPEKEPWRDLTALLGFLVGQRGLSCPEVEKTLLRARKQVPVLGIWAGGLRVSNNSGEHYISGSDDFVDSRVELPSASLGADWFTNLETETLALEKVSKAVYAATMGYNKAQKINDDSQAKAAGNIFWQLCGALAQDLIKACGMNTQDGLRPSFAGFALRAYDAVCPRDTARQLEDWAQNKPRLGNYWKK